MYGTRDAASTWERYYVSALEEAGYQAGTASGCMFSSKGGISTGAVHGDDFVFEGPEDMLLELERNLKGKMIIKRKALLGPS
eukprot:6131985-Amphidinium_carterae.1